MRSTTRATSVLLAALWLLAGCSGDGDSGGASTVATTAGTIASTVGEGVATTTVDTAMPADSTLPADSTVPPEPTGVAGIDAADPFCASWARYSGTVQAIGVAVAFGGLDSAAVARLEVIAAGALVAAVDGISANWPEELAGEHDAVLADLLGPYQRRAEKALAAARDAGLTDDQLAVLGGVWLDALRTRDNASPVITVGSLDSGLDDAVARAAGAFDAAVTPFADDPSLMTAAGDTPSTDRYLVDHCPDLANSGVGDEV